MTYRIELRPAAAKALRKLDEQAQRRIQGALALLAENPRPPAARPLVGRPAWRVRTGDYRIIYQIEDGVLLVAEGVVRALRARRLAESMVIACGLSGGDQAERIAQWRRLLTGVRRESVEGGVRFYLPVELAGEVAELAVAEHHCCPFFEFALRLAGGGLELHVHAPAEAAPLLVEVFGSAH